MENIVNNELNDEMSTSLISLPIKVYKKRWLILHLSLYYNLL